MATTESIKASSEVKGELWGARARGWAQVQEPAQALMYPPVFDAARVRDGTRLLDVGCGSGVAAAIAAKRGANITGIDGSRPSIEIARERVPGAEFQVGELEGLPYEDATFEVVTGFNSFQYATDPVHALSEAKRVVRPGGTVVILTWGRAENCEAAPLLATLGSSLPPPPPGAPGPFALSEPGVLEKLAREACLTPACANEIRTLCEYPDLKTALRGRYRQAQP